MANDFATEMRADDIVRVPTGDATLRWFFIVVAVVGMAVMTAIIVPGDLASWSPVGVFLLVILLMGLFPNREIDLANRSGCFRLQFLNCITVLRLHWQVDDSYRVQVHVTQVDESSKCVHKVACVGGWRRITLRDCVKSDGVPDDEVCGFANKIAAGLRLPCDGYVKRPGFSWW